MTYNKKRALSYGGILISVLLAYFCRLVRPENVFMRNLADQCRNCIYLGMYCAWVIYLEKHVVHRKTRRCLTAIGCLMVFWFFVRTVKFHIFHDPLGEHICWYLYYIPMILIPVLGLAAAMFLGEKDGEKTGRKIIVLLVFAVIMIVCVFTNGVSVFRAASVFGQRLQLWYSFYSDPGMDHILPDMDGNYADQKKQDSGKEAILAACHSGNIAAGMEYREFTPSAPDQNNCRGYDSSMLPFDGGNLSGVYIMRPDTDK